ncbi:sugar transporter SWEET1-like [Liolophura sinensis]|uniref:sugar transporter SWEET1-like n=1 Tax=Liolophura sinensis TaxID=3198878 RepID=UPI0031586F0E
MGDAKFMLSWITAITSVVVQMVGMQICFRIVRKGSTGDMSNIPFLSYFICACIWLRYGLLTHIPAVVLVNLTAALLQFSYMTVFYLYCLQRTHLYRQYMIGCSTLFGILAYIKYFVPDEATAKDHLGLLGCLFTVIGYGAPLATLADVLQTKSTESMSFLMCFANLVVAFEWGWYGYLLKDAYIGVPNIFGIILGALQMYLFIKFPSSKTRSTSKALLA